MRRSRSRSALPAALTAFVLLAACSGPQEPPSAGDASEAAMPVDAPTEVAMTEGASPGQGGSAPVPTVLPAPPRTYEGEVALRFTDVSQQAGVDLLHESPLEDKEDGRRFMGGAAAGDIDGDGLADLFVIGGGNRPDALYRNNGDGTFTDIAAEAGVDAPHVGAGVTMADYDGDGHTDIYVTSHGPVEAREPGQHRLFHNDGDGTFTDVAREAGVAFSSVGQADGFGAAFSDVDADGDLDLFVAGWRRGSDSNRLYRNNGDGTFTDVTEDAGIDAIDARGFGPCWTDLDDDLDPDLLLIADFGTTQVWRNEGDGTFTESRSEYGISLGDSQAMGTTVADVNNDGLLDWYVTAIYDDDGNGRGLGNQLFMAQPDGRFVEASAEMGVADGGWGWGTVAVDLDHDGFVDLVETNGWNLPSYTDEPAKVFRNRGGTGFDEVAAEVGLDHAIDGLSVVELDLENDGDLDIAITAANDRFSLWRNDLDGAATGWLQVVLDTSDAAGLAPHGYGSRVTVEADGQTQVRALDGCANYLSSSPHQVHFGLADADAVDRLTVRWADGTETVLEDVEPNQVLTVSPA